MVKPNDFRAAADKVWEIAKEYEDQNWELAQVIKDLSSELHSLARNHESKKDSKD